MGPAVATAKTVPTPRAETASRRGASERQRHLHPLDPPAPVFALIAQRRSEGTRAPALRLAASFALALVAFLALTATPASAKEIHAFKESFGEAGTGNGQFALAEHSSVAINKETGNVYVTDTGNGRVQEFSAGGTFIRAFGTFTTPAFLAVDNSSGEESVYVADFATNTVSKFEADGTPVTAWGTAGLLSEAEVEPGVFEAFGELAGIAVGPAGNLFVLGTSNRMFKFAPDGSSIEHFETEFGTAPGGIAVDSTGDLYKVRGSGAVAKLTPTGGALIEEVDPGPATGLAVDPANDDLYVDGGSQVAHRNAAGEALETFGSPEPPGGELSAAQGLAIAANHFAYVANQGAQKIAVFKTALTPTVATGEASGLETTGEATLNGTVDPEGLAVGECQFEYGPTAAYGETLPCSPAPGSGTDPEPISAAITGLALGRYHFRLLASNANGTTFGEDHTFLAASPPTVSSEAFLSATATTATLKARLDPNGLATTYQLEYGPTAAYGSATPPTSFGAGFEAGAVQPTLTGLQPSTTYHVRFSANNARGTVLGTQDLAFTTAAAGGTTTGGECPNPNLTGFSPLLPDCRAYEDVSAAGGPGEIYTPPTPEMTTQHSEFRSEFPTRAAASGGAVAYVGEVGSAGGNGLTGQGLGNQFLASRTAAGWTATDLSPGLKPEAISSPPVFESFSSDLSLGLLSAPKSTALPAVEPAGPPDCEALYAVEADRPYHALFTATQTPGVCGGSASTEGYKAQNLLFAGANAGTAAVVGNTHLLFQSPAPLTPEANQSVEGEPGANLYESVAGATRLVSVLPGPVGQPVSNAVFGGYDPPSAFSGEDETSSSRPDFENAISADGSLVFWTDLENGQIYLRRDGVETSPVSTGPASYRGATPDGRYVFYLEAGALWRFDTAATPAGAREQLAPPSASVRGVLGASADGSYLYFVAAGALAPGVEARNCATAKNEREQLESEGQVGELVRLGEEEEEEFAGFLPPSRGCNLYLRHAGQTTYVTALAATDNSNRRTTFGLGFRLGDWRGDLGARTAQLAAGGRQLVFQSTLRLTGYDNSLLRTSSTPLGAELGNEVFVYEAPTGRLLCVSCDPTGAPPAPEPISLGTYLPTSSAPTFIRRWVSADGNRVFFDAAQPLAPQDTNRRQDVYQWERAGTAGCPVAQGAAGGCISLLSGGNSNEFSFFLDASENGDDVFLTHQGQLAGIGGAAGGGAHVFDVRVGGGFPSAARGCTGPTCQSQPPAPSAPPPPASSAFEGLGNLKAGCPKGKVKKQGKCVKKRHHKKKGKKHTHRRASNNRGAAK